MRKRSISFCGLVFLLIAFIISCAQNPVVDTKQYGSIAGKVLYSNSDDHSGIVLTLDKTDGLRAISYDDDSRAIISMATSKKDGSFSFSNLEPGTYTIYASSNDSIEKAVSTNVVVRSTDLTTVEDLHLTATGSISGYVTFDGNTSGNTGFLVFLAGTSYVAVTDDNGYYCMTGVPAGQNYQLVVSKGSFISSDVTSCSVSAHVINNAGIKNILSKDMNTGSSSLVWKGSFSSAPDNPAVNWAYYNANTGCSYIFDGNEWSLLASKGDKGDQGEQGQQGDQGQQGETGATGTSITWKGSLVSAPENPGLYWAYFNSSDGCSYIFDGNMWVLLAAKGAQGEQGIQGESGSDGADGTDGAAGSDGVSIIWLGSFATAPADPAKLNAYYNTETGCSYIYNGTTWDLLASKGAQGEQGPQGETGATGTSITWKGSFATDPENPSLYWAYFNVEDGCSYIYDGTQWTLLAARGAQGIQGDTGAQGETGAQGPQGEQGIQGETGAAGAAGADGVSIIWLGSFATTPANPAKLNAYYNTQTGCSYIYNGSTWELLASKGAQGEQGPQGAQGEQGPQGPQGETGATGISITWKGSLAVAPENPSLYWAYFNTGEGCSYIYDGTQWTLLAAKGEQGEQGIQGETGAAGAAGADGVSIIWLGSFAVAPVNPAKLNAYYNTETGCSYIYNGTTWELLASKGAQGEQGPQGAQGEQGPQGSQGETGATGTSITWKGSFATAPENPSLYWAYFNIGNGCSYIFNGTKWTLLAQKGEQGENGVDGADGQSIIWKGSFASENDLMNPEKLWAYFNLQDGCSYIYSGTEWELLVKGGESTATTSGDGIRIPNIVKNSDNTIAWDAVENAYCYEIWVEINDGEIAESELIPTTTWNLDEAELFESFKETKQDTKFKYRIRAIADPSTGKDNSSWSVMFNGYYDYVAGNPYSDEHKQYGLGKAVNLLEGSYTDIVSGKTSIFDEKKQNNIEIEEDLSKHGKGHSEMREGSSVEEYLESCSVTVKTKLGAKETLFGVTYGMKFEVTSGYSATVEARTEMYFLNFVSEYIGKEYSFKNFNDPSKYEGFLSDDFLNDARKTQDNWAVEGNLENFIHNYGTHIITDVIVGAKFSAYYTKIGDRESFGEKDSFKIALEGSVGVKDLASFEVGEELGLEAEQFASSEDVSVSASFDFIGGSNFGALPVMNGSNIGKIEEEYSKWAQTSSNEDNYALIDVANGSLFCVWDFLPDDEFHLLKEKLNEYFLRKDNENYEAIKAKIGTFYAETVTDAIVYSFDTNNPGFESLSDGNEKSGIIKNVKDLFTESIEIVNYGYEVPCLPVPSLEYYDFVGWYTEDGVRVTDENGTVIVSDVPKLIEDGKWALDKSSSVLYSRWEKKYSDYMYLSEQNSLNMIGTNTYGKYLLVEDIDYSKEDVAAYYMIDEFYGTLDGGGHAIKNYVVSSIEGSEVGIVGINKGIIKNIAFINCEFTRISNPDRSKAKVSLCAGIVCGKNLGIIDRVLVKSSTIVDCRLGVYEEVYGNSNTYDVYCGLICGIAESDSIIRLSGVVESNAHALALTGEGGTAGSHVGGLAGKCDGAMIENCYSVKNNLTAHPVGRNLVFHKNKELNAYCGGLVGVLNSGNINRCISHGNSCNTYFEASGKDKYEGKGAFCGYVKDGAQITECSESTYLPSSFSTEIWDNSKNPPVVKNDWKYAQ